MRRRTFTTVLKVAKGGPRLSPFKDGTCVDRSPGVVLPAIEKRPNCGNNLISRRGANMAWVATRIDIGCVTSVLALLMRRPVIDKTDVVGLFDVSVELPPLQPEAGVSVQFAIDTNDSGPSVFTVLRGRIVHATARLARAIRTKYPARSASGRHRVRGKDCVHLSQPDN